MVGHDAQTGAAKTQVDNLMWPFNREPEKRNYTQLTVAEAEARAHGPTLKGHALAAVEGAAGIYANAFASARVEPSTEALTPELLSHMGRFLITKGEVVFGIEVTDGGIELLPAMSWDVSSGGASPRSWRYTVELPGPSQVRTIRTTHDGVVHLRYSYDPTRPHRGVSPLARAQSTLDLARHLEWQLTQEMASTVGQLVPIPQDAFDLEAEGAAATLADLIGRLRGSTLPVPTMSHEGNQGRFGAAQYDYAPKRLGAMPPQPLVDLRRHVTRTIATACQIPVELMDGGDGTARRESYRQFLHGSVAPLARLVEGELSAKLDTDITLNFDALFASDVQGRARAYGAMVSGGMDEQVAAELAGLL